MEKQPMFMDWKNSSKKALLPKLIHRFDAIPIRIWWLRQYLLAMQETWVQSSEEGVAMHSSILA